MNRKAVALGALIVVPVLLVFMLTGPYPQPLDYHGFADDRSMLGIPNALDVLSNVPFIIIGAIGLFAVFNIAHADIAYPHRIHYWVFFIGFLLTGIGSGYYHLSPNNETLVWDRLPMTIAFMGFLGSVLSELIDRTLARRLLPVLLLIGIASVAYWAWTEAHGRGDLRFYGLVQFLPMLLIPTMLVLYDPRPGYVKAVLCMGGFYVLAKVFEHFDDIIFELLTLVSGHSLKHVAAAIGGIYIIRLLKTEGHDHSKEVMKPIGEPTLPGE